MSSKKERALPSNLGLPLTGVDSHAHLDSKPLWADLEGVLSRAAEAGVARIGQIFLSYAAYTEKIDAMLQRAAAVPNAPELFFILGVHPSDGLQAPEDEWDNLRRAFLADSRLRAVGEIGLDYHWPDCPPDVQDRIFREQLRMAKELGKPVVIHSRDAFEPTIAILEAENFHNRPLLWHCFGGNADAARLILDHGWHISIPGPVTYSANQELRNALAVIPADRLMLETDCPYLAPLPWRGQTNEPALSVFTAEVVAREKSMTLAELWTLVGSNATHFFKAI